MNIIALILAKFGFGGKSLDKALGLLTKLDAELEAYDKAEQAKIAKAEEAVRKAEEKARTAVLAAEAVKEASAEDVARAARIRARVKDLAA